MSQQYLLKQTPTVSDILEVPADQLHDPQDEIDMHNNKSYRNVYLIVFAYQLIGSLAYAWVVRRAFE